MTLWRREPRSVCRVYDEDEYVAGEDEYVAEEDEYMAGEEWDALPNAEQASSPSRVSHSSRLLVCGLLITVSAGALGLFVREALENRPAQPAVLGESSATGRPAVSTLPATRQGAPEVNVHRRAKPTSILLGRVTSTPSVSRRTQLAPTNPAAITWGPITWGPCTPALAHAPACGQMRQTDRAWQAGQAATPAVVPLPAAGEQSPDTEFGFER
jgi:hypothetical protein